MTATLQDTRAVKATEPSKRWRNKYFSARGYMPCPKCGVLHSADGTIYTIFGCGAHPSKEIAETIAERNLKSRAYGLTQYLGAFPE